MLVAVVLVGGTAAAQEGKTVDKLKGKELRKQKKKERTELFELQKKEGSALIEERDFVLQAERLRGKNSLSRNVSNQINFIKIDGDNLTVQFGDLFAGNGRNGLGGVTYDGTIKRLESVDLGEGKSFTTSIQFSAPFLNSVATINISVRGNQARAAFWSNGQVLNFEGFYYSNENSSIQKSGVTDFF